MKKFIEEPKGTTYKELLNVAFSICDEFLLVKRDQHDLNENGEKFIEEIKPYVKEIKRQEEWPGTTLLGHYADVYYFHCHQELKEILTNKTERLYQWLTPELLEDICFLKNGEVWLATVAHEKIGVIMSKNQSELERVIGIEGITMS
ncbi:hypothetical protein JJQ72_01390 [Paenibacillus sp. F411]|uniref:hypothetical protein n=1 Tax=Paenibacillus sp. F411 TaxID=2820239 RepID=UPI001AB002BE|nr:hypothetical protein [Paenibacillus sp. F411]MBO2942637.1 hypothetical protein [Paenibacillus sp. F411]